MERKDAFSFPSASGDDAAPPSYTETVSQTSDSKVQSATSGQNHSQYSALISSQLSTLPSQINSLETQKVFLAHAKDEKVLSLLTTYIENYLSSFATSGFRKGTLILVPAVALEEYNEDRTTPSDYDFRDEEEYDKVVRVKDGKDTNGLEGDAFFWRDEEMAERLAGYLKPVPAQGESAELPPRNQRAQPQAKQTETSSSKGFWGRKKSLIGVESPVAAHGEQRDAKSDQEVTVQPVKDTVSMNVTAEEIVFRTENDFGIYGTERGWCIVLKLAVLLSGR